MKKVQNANVQGKVLNELYKRYEDRGMIYDGSPEYAAQKSREIATRTAAPKSYKVSAGNVAHLKKYKNGVSGARRYMTDGDFADYYKAIREYSPQANVELESTILLHKVEKNNKTYKMKAEKNDIKKKLKAEADRNNPKHLSTKKEAKSEKISDEKCFSTSLDLKKIAKEAAKTWIPLEERHEENIVEGIKTKIPTRVILAIFAITISLLMIVASTVLLSSAQREQNNLKEDIEALDFQISELKTQLNKKNEDIDIEFFAEEVL